MISDNDYLNDVEKKIVEQLSLLYKKDEIRGNDTKWTEVIKQEIVKIGQNLNYKAYASQCNSADGSEWLFDITWLNYKNRQIVDSILAVECEWNDSETGIFFDFQKLLLAKVNLKVMICNPIKAHTPDETINKMISEVKIYNKTEINERYLFFVWNKEEDNFIYKLFINDNEQQKILSVNDIKKIFAKEFSIIRDKFIVLDMPLLEAEENVDSNINRPGVYAHWHPNFGVVRVGKSQSNSKSRAFEHFRDGTKTDTCDMRQLREDPDTHLIFFNIRFEEDKHWILSVENYLEKKVNPSIPPGRIG